MHLWFHVFICMYVGVCECMFVMLSPLTQYLQQHINDSAHMWHADTPYWGREPYCSWWRSQVIWCHQRSNSINLVNTVSWDRKYGYAPYLACGCILKWRLYLIERTLLLFLREILLVKQQLFYLQELIMSWQIFSFFPFVTPVLLDIRFISFTH